ncbi:hypothetical protein AWR27_07360 [Spirosoma montaniterrae]|uniref:CHAT domain-containing protein n=2 Tax=Spirosoma montaniterrae TaxID=1178516 RepID=A0A1P9WUT4_9BACT|nr:hypothetical protein AWR27_07360 [Spirosoma montaniterrae]
MYAHGASPAALAVELRTILQKPLSDQNKLLTDWQQRWNRAGYAKDSAYVNALLQVGMLRLFDGKYDDAATTVQQAVTVCRTNPGRTRPADLSKALYRLGVIYNLQSKIEPAITVLKQAVMAGQNSPEAATWVANAYLYLAYAYDTKSDFQQTITQADFGLQTSARLGNKPLTANLLRQKAQALNSLQRYAEAQQAVEQAIQTIEHEPGLTAALADNYSLLSIILGHQHQPERALRYAQQAFASAKSIAYNQAPSMANRVCFLLNNMGRYDEALAYGQYTIATSKDPFRKAEALQLMGVTYWKKGDYARSLQLYQQGITELPINYANRNIEQLPDDQRIRLVAHKEVLFTLLRDKADTWLDYANATRNNRQRLQHALDTYKAADQLIDFMRWEHTGQQSKLFWRQKTRGLYERAIETCYRLNDSEQAFRFMEKSRAVLLADQLNELGARQQLSLAQTGMEHRLRLAVGEQQTKLAVVQPDSPDYGPSRAALTLKQDSLETFLRQLETSNPAYFRYKYDNHVPPLTDVNAFLAGHGTSLVTYFVGDSALYVLSLDGRKAKLVRQSVSAYNQTIRAFMPLLTTPDALSRRTEVERFWALGSRLYQQLLAPLSLPKGRVVVSPDGFFIPFETLSRSATRDEYLVADYAFSYVYSARLLLRNQGNPARLAALSSHDFVGMAPVAFASTLKQVALPGSDEALKPIAARFGSSVLVTGPAATRRTFLSEAADARVVHLFTHATADTSQREPLLYFADSTLRLSDLADGQLTNTQLVVLAACKTAVGANQRGEGVFSLARGFAALGVPSILTTLWSVENKATYEITNLFYQYVADGLPKDEALQQAKQDWLRTADGANRLPNVWAGLILVGNTEPLDQPSRWPWVAGGLLVLLGAGGVWWWRRMHRLATPAVAWLRPV